MTEPDTHTTDSRGNAPGPDAMLGLWASWVDQMSALTQSPSAHGRPWWEMTADMPAANGYRSEGGSRHSGSPCRR